MQIEKFILQPFGYEFVGSDWGLEVFNVEVLMDGDLLRETGVREGPADVNRLWGRGGILSISVVGRFRMCIRLLFLLPWQERRVFRLMLCRPRRIRWFGDRGCP